MSTRCGRPSSPSSPEPPWPITRTRGEATAHVLSGRVRIGVGTDSWEGRDGDLIVIPPARHNLAAIEDSVVLLTVAKINPKTSCL
jgi:quercetin dioxygenase-like cupin family protein